MHSAAPMGTQGAGAPEGNSLSEHNPERAAERSPAGHLRCQRRGAVETPRLYFLLKFCALEPIKGVRIHAHTYVRASRSPPM
jgi:hypothetical protein